MRKQTNTVHVPIDNLGRPLPHLELLCRFLGEGVEAADDRPVVGGHCLARLPHHLLFYYI